jgi:hypothetical protein
MSKIAFKKKSLEYIHIYKKNYDLFNFHKCGEQYEEFCFEGNYDNLRKIRYDDCFEVSFDVFQKKKV